MNKYVHAVVKDNRKDIYLYKENEKLNIKIDELYKTIEAKDKIINEQVLEIARLKEKIDKAIEFIKEKDLTNNANFMDDGVGYLFEDLLEILGDKDIEFDVLKALNTDLPDDIEMG